MVSPISFLLGLRYLATATRALGPTNYVRVVYEDGVWKFYGPAAAVGKCAGEMQLVVDAGKAVKDTSPPNAATTYRKERRAKAKEKAKKMAEGKKDGAAYAAPPASPDSQSSGGRDKAHILSPANRSSWQRTRPARARRTLRTG
jgi:hypothetical protein